MGLVIRKLQKNPTIGNYVLTLPRPWLDLIEYRHHQKLRVVEMRADEKGLLIIRPAVTTNKRIHGDDEFDDPEPGSRPLLMGLREAKLRRMLPSTNLILARTYTVGHDSVLLSLPGGWVTQCQRNADKPLYHVRVFMLEERLVLEPLFLNLPKRVRQPP